MKLFNTSAYLLLFLAIVFLLSANAYAQIPAYKSWLVNGTSLYSLSPFIGVGTANPTVRLHVRAQSEPEEELIHLENNVGTRYYFKVSNVAAGQRFLIGGNAGDSIALTAAGDVGIGTAVPTQKLEVNGGIKMNTNHPKPACDASTRGTLWLTQGSPDSAEICKTSPKIAAQAASLPSTRAGLSCASDSSTGKIYCFGGWQGTTLFNQILEYTPSSDMLAVKSATLPTARHTLSCAEYAATNKIYCFGGWSGSPLSQIVEYTPATDTIVIKSATLPSGRDELSCTEFPANSRIYCFGGDYYNQILEYNPSTDTLLIKSATLPTARRGLSCATLVNKVYCFGGEVQAAGGINQVTEYDPLTDTLTIKQTELPGGPYGTPVGRDDFSCVLDQGTARIYCFGGNVDDSAGIGLQSAEIFEYMPAAESMKLLSHKLPSTRAYLSCAKGGSSIFCFGGSFYAVNTGAGTTADLAKVVGFFPLTYQWIGIG